MKYKITYDGKPRKDMEELYARLSRGTVIERISPFEYGVRINSMQLQGTKSSFVLDFPDKYEENLKKYLGRGVMNTVGEKLTD